MRRFTFAALALIATLQLAACRSPFGLDPEPETGPDAGKVGRGIHGWPLLEQAPHGSGWRTDVLWPGYSGITTDGDGLNSTAMLLPIFLFESEGNRTRTGVLRPVFDLETRKDEDGNNEVFDLDVLWPIFKWVDSPETTERRVAPFYFSEEWGDSGLWHAWPLYGREWRGTQEKQWILAPLFSHDSDPERDVSLWDVPWPLIHFGNSGDEEQLRLFPLLWHEASPGEHATVVFPFIWDIEDQRSKFEMVFPFYAHQDSSSGNYVRSIVPPLYITGKEGDAHHTALAAGIVGWRTTPERWAMHVFPVLWLERGDDGDSLTHVWPLFGWKEQGDSREASTLWPFFTYEWDDDSWELDAPWPLGKFSNDPRGGEVRMWPLFCNQSRERSDGGIRNEGNVGLILSTWESDGEDESEFRVLWKLVESTSHAGKDTFVVNPLFRHETNDAGDTYWSFLFGMISRKQEAGEVDWSFFWFL